MPYSRVAGKNLPAAKAIAWKQALRLKDSGKSLVEASISLPALVLLMSMAAALPLVVQSVLHLVGAESLLSQQAIYVSSALLLVTGHKFFTSFIKSIFNFQFTGYALVALGALAALGLSLLEWAKLAPEATSVGWMLLPALSFPTLLASPFISKMAMFKGIHGESIDDLHVLPKEARPKSAKGLAKKVPLGTIRPGDIIKLLPGEVCPVDGIISEGIGDFSGGWVTGDTLPRSKAPGETVFAGEQNLNGTLSIQATKAGNGSALYEAMQYSRNVKRRPFVDRARMVMIKRYTWLLIFTAIGAALFTAFQKTNPILALDQALMILALGAPVGLGFMTSFPLLVTAKKLSRYGVNLHDVRIGDRMQKITQFMLSPLDFIVKRGPSMGLVQTLDGESQIDHIKMAFAIMKATKHPLTNSLLQVLKVLEEDLSDLPNFDRVKSIPGYGAIAEMGERKFILGSPTLLSKLGVKYRQYDKLAYEIEKIGHTAVWLAEVGLNNQPKAIFEFAPSMRPSSAISLKALKDMDLEVLMAPGLAANKMAASLKNLKIDGYINAQSVQDMMKSVLIRQQRGDSVCFIGSSILDMAAMRAADVSIASVDGPKIVRDHAPITMRVPDPAIVTKTLSMCRAASLKSFSNLWAMFSVSGLGIAMTMLGLMSTKVMIALALLSFFAVIINGLLLLKD